MSKADVKATVFIPTYNGDKYLAEILKAIYKQKANFAFEVLIIDSGSKDKTLEIIHKLQKKHSSLRLHQIPNSEFGHGRTRNVAAHMANGEVVVYLSHDATPAHDRWLYEMVRPFEINDKIVGVMGKQIPRGHCIPMLKSEIHGVFGGFGPDFGTTIFYKDTFVKNQGIRDAISFYSDVNSAARKDYLTGKFPYADVPYAEDHLFGRDVINAGYYKVYAARGSVIHSNDLRLREYKHRMFDETLGLIRIGGKPQTPSRKDVLKLVVRGTIRDTRNILRDRDYSSKRKLYWLAVNPLFHVEKWRGVRTAGLAGLKDTEVADSWSLEKQKTRDSK